jgi:hypothetical protein
MAFQAVEVADGYDKGREEGGKEEGLGRMLRHLLILLGCLLCGFLIGGSLGAAIDGHGRPPFPFDAAPKFAIGGTVVGVMAWVFYLTSIPPKTTG